jgi:hypothetical protein
MGGICGGDSHSPINFIYELCLKSGGIKQLRKSRRKEEQKKKRPSGRKGSG